MQLREGREVRSKTVDNNNNPEYNQTFRLLVDDPESQVSLMMMALFRLLKVTYWQPLAVI